MDPNQIMNMVSQISPWVIFYNIFYGIIGMGYFVYGKKNNHWFLISGICLMVFTYVVDGTTAIALTGAALVVAPFVLTKMYGD